MNLGAALVMGIHNFAASRTGKSAYFVPGAALESNRRVLALPSEPDVEVPPTWKQIKLVETKLSNAENITGLLENNPDVLTGETPGERAFIVQQYFFTEPPTIDDRIIMIATGQNFSITNVDPLAEFERFSTVYRLVCRAL